MTPSVQVSHVDLTDRDQLLSWNEVMRECYAAGRDAVWWRSPEATIGQFRDPKPDRVTVALCACADGRLVGGAEGTADPDEPAEIEVGVLPAARRQGIGTALLAEVRRGLAGVTTIAQTETYCDAGVAFAQHHGMTVGIEEFRQLLPLPTTVPQPAPGTPAEVRSWTGPCPDDLVADWATLKAQMSEDVPMGTLTRTVRAADIERVRRSEARMAAQHYVLVRSLARVDGRAVGYTEIFLNTGAPEIVTQDDTLVDRAHRGRGIGWALKLANLRQLLALPETARSRWLQTYTATTNASMLALNARLGFRTADTMTALEGPL